MSNLKRVLIMAGGTGGHVFPALAVAKKLQEAHIDVAWLGTKKGLEAKLVPANNIPLHFIDIAGFRGKKIINFLTLPWRLSVAIFQASFIIQKFKPDVVIGMGGFVSGPGGIASFLLRKTLIIHEQNAIPGFTNKYLAKIADRVLEAFPKTFKPSHKVLTIGNPLRDDISLITHPKQRERNKTEKAHLLICGGSLGADAINQIVPRTLAKLPDSIRPEIYHQTGEKHWEKTQQLYEQLALQAKVVPFIEDMGEAYQWADLVVCRAGALTVAELCAAGVGCIFIPYPFAVDDHQTANANYMVKHHAALLIQQSNLNEEVLLNLLQDLCTSAEKRTLMAEAAYQLRNVDASLKVLTICREVCH